MEATRVVRDDPAAEAAKRIAAAVRPGAHIVLTGGSTPRDAYALLASRTDLDWGGTTIWFSDERCVAPDDELSNYGMAAEALLDRISEPGPNVARMRGEDGPEAGSRAYEELLTKTFDGAPPRFDLAILGLGPDRHVASMFPGMPAIEERERLVLGVPEAGMEPLVPRITLTLRALDSAREVLFLVAGEGKAEAVADAFGGEPGPDRPASMVAPRDGTLTLILDPAAGRGSR